MKRVGMVNCDFNCGTMGAKSWPSAPRPCSQMTAARGDSLGLISKQGRADVVVIVMDFGISPRGLYFDAVFQH